jgi:hypothetical protein
MMGRKRKKKTDRIEKAEFITPKDSPDTIREKLARLGFDLVDLQQPPVLLVDDESLPDVKGTEGKDWFRTQEAAAKKIGVNPKTLHRWEGKGMPKPGGLYLLSILREWKHPCKQGDRKTVWGLVSTVERASKSLAEMSTNLTAAVQELEKNQKGRAQKR